MPEYYVLRTKPQQEFKIEADLIQLGYGAYCPRFKMRKPSSRYVKSKREIFITRPLFNSYLFLSSQSPDWYQIKRVKGVIGYISNQGIPLSIQGSVVDTLKKQEEFGINDKSELKLKIGQEIEILEGLLKGQKGKFQGMKGKDISLEIQLFGNTMNATLPVELLKIGN